MFSESQMIAKMKILAVFLLAVLDCSLTEGRLVPKCELWSELKNATANLTLNGNNLVAKLVCQAELASGLNTTVVKQAIEKEVSHNGDQAEDHHGKEENHGGNNDRQINSRPSRHRGRRDDKGRSLQTRPLQPANPAQNSTSAGLNNSTETHQDSHEKEDDHNEGRKGHVRGRRHDRRPSPPNQPPAQNSTSAGLNNSTETHQDSHEKEDDHNEGRKGHVRGRRHGRRPSPPNQPPAQNCVFYGVFQLSSCTACNDSVTPTANVCGTPCSNFLDDDISDDISCLLNLLKIRGNHSDNHSGEKLREQGGVIGTISDDACEHEKDSVYTAEC